MDEFGFKQLIQNKNKKKGWSSYQNLKKMILCKKTENNDTMNTEI